MSHIRKTLSATIVSVLATGAAHADTLDKIRETGTLTLGFRESSIPFSYLGADQQPVGLSIDLCNAVAEKVKSELSLPDLTVKFVAVNASNRIPLIQNETVDLECGSTTNTAARQEQVAFSVATFASETSWLVREDSEIKKEDDLQGKTVVITQGSLNLQVGSDLNAEKELNLTIIQGKEQAESLLLLRTERASAWFEDNILQAGLVANSPDPTALRFVPSSYEVASYYGLMFRKDDPAFKELVDGVIVEKMQSGEFENLYNTWFTQPIPPNGQNLNLPMSAAMQARVAHPSDALTP